MGRKRGVDAVDRLNIVAHDRFQEIIDEASRPGSVIHLQKVILDPTSDLQKTVTVVAQSNVLHQIDKPAEAGATPPPGAKTPAPIFRTEAEQQVAQITYEVIKRHESLPGSAALLKRDVQAAMIKEVAAAYKPVQQELEGISKPPDIKSIVARTTELVV